MSKDWKDGYDEGFYRAEQEASVRVSRLEQEIGDLEGHIEALSQALDHSNEAIGHFMSVMEAANER